MRRVKYACLEQTLRFSLREPFPPEETTRLVRTEVEQYKADLERKKIRFHVDSETVLPDGSIELKIKKQYNAHECGAYLD